jgi:hypothetical protein
VLDLYDRKTRGRIRPSGGAEPLKIGDVVQRGSAQLAL